MRQDDQGVQGVQRAPQPQEEVVMPAKARAKPKLRPPSLGGHPRAGVRNQGGNSACPAGRKGLSLPTKTGAGDIRNWLSGGPRSKITPADSLKMGDSGGQ